MSWDGILVPSGDWVAEKGVMGYCKVDDVILTSICSVEMEISDMILKSPEQQNTQLWEPV